MIQTETDIFSSAAQLELSLKAIKAFYWTIFGVSYIIVGSLHQKIIVLIWFSPLWELGFTKRLFYKLIPLDSDIS